MNCSRCGKKINDVVVKITQRLEVFEYNEGLYKPLPNLNEPTSEFLCPECFDKYAKCINMLNQESEKIAGGIDMVQVVDEVQYANQCK